MSIQEIESRIKNKGIIPIPANTGQIQSVLDNFKIEEFPSTYNEFLKRMGNGTRNGFLQGSSCFFNELENLKEWSLELLKENNSKLILSDNDFVFWMHQGYQFSFFKLDEGDDPPVYYYTEVTNQLDYVKITNSFTNFLSRIESRDRYLFRPQ